MVSGSGAFRNGQTTGLAASDTSGGAYEALNSYSQGSASGGYVVQQTGESLRSIALQLWGDGALWYKLAEANGLSAQAQLVEGQHLNVPAGVARSAYNADTLKPYDANDATGNVSPTTPKPRKANNCGVFGQVLLAAVAIAVTVIALPAGGPASGLLGIGQGAAAGVAGSVVSQGVGVATGIQDKFSFKAVAMAGIGGAVGAGLGGSGVFGKTVDGAFKAGSIGIRSAAVNAAVQGAVSSALTQGIGVATRLQGKFSWTGVAAAGIGAGVGSAAARELNLRAFDAPGGKSFVNIAGHTLANTAGAMADAATRSAINGSSFGDNLMRALPSAIANTIGNLVAHEVAGGGRKGGISSDEKSLEAEADKSANRQLGGNVVQSPALDVASETEITEIVVTASRQDALYIAGVNDPLFSFVQYGGARPGRGHNGPPQRVPRLPSGPPNARTERSILGTLDELLGSPFTGPARQHEFEALQERLSALKGQLLQLDPFYESIGPVSGQETWQSVRSLESVIAEIQLGSTRAEAIASKTMIDLGYVQLPSKLGGDRGFDGVFVRYDASGRPVQGVITESKYRSSGRFSLDRTNMGGQMSETWVKGNIQKMIDSPSLQLNRSGAILDQLRSNNQIVRAANMLTPSGQTRWYSITTPKK